MSKRENSMLSEVKRALRNIPRVVKQQEQQFEQELKFANKIFRKTIKEIYKFSTLK